MKHIRLGDLDVGRIGLGTMGMSAVSPERVATTLRPSAPFTGRSTWPGEHHSEQQMKWLDR
jgi:aryl-alcohol dehydrogenase-like predicted oxidoreductase